MEKFPILDTGIVYSYSILKRFHGADVACDGHPKVGGMASDAVDNNWVHWLICEKELFKMIFEVAWKLMEETGLQRKISLFFVHLKMKSAIRHLFSNVRSE